MWVYTIYSVAETLHRSIGINPITCASEDSIVVYIRVYVTDLSAMVTVHG